MVVVKLWHHYFSSVIIDIETCHFNIRNRIQYTQIGRPKINILKGLKNDAIDCYNSVLDCDQVGLYMDQYAILSEFSSQMVDQQMSIQAIDPRDTSREKHPGVERIQFNGMTLQWNQSIYGNALIIVNPSHDKTLL